MELKEGYKITEIGIIPNEWNQVKLEYCLAEKPMYGINAAAVEFNDNLPAYIRITDISEDSKYIKKNRVSVIYSDTNKYILHENDIVFARTGATVGKSYLYNQADGILVFAGFLIRTRINENIAIPRYIKACMETSNYWNWIKMISIRSGQPGINGKELSSYLLPLATINEQKNIAEAFNNIDNLINYLTKIIDKKKNIKLGAMKKLLSGEKRIIGFSEAWITLRLDSICKVNKGQLITSDTILTGNIPVIAGGMQPAYYHKFANRNANTITISASGANAGFVAFYDEPIFASDCSTIEENNDMYNIYFVYSILLLKQNEIFNSQTGGAQPHVHPKDLEKLVIKIPTTIEEQNEIAKLLYDMDKEIIELERKLYKYQLIKEGMMEELLTGRIRLI